MVRQWIATPLFPSSNLGVALAASIELIGGHGEMVDTADLKSVDFKIVRVQIPLSPKTLILPLQNLSIRGLIVKSF